MVQGRSPRGSRPRRSPYVANRVVTGLFDFFSNKEVPSEEPRGCSLEFKWGGLEILGTTRIIYASFLKQNIYLKKGRVRKSSGDQLPQSLRFNMRAAPECFFCRAWRENDAQRQRGFDNF